MKSILEISKMIDHSLLHPTFTDDFLISECKIAKELNVASVCIKPHAVVLAKDILSNSTVEVGTVIGFPHGSSKIDIKLKEIELACNEGATEIDFVVNIGKVLSGDWSYIDSEIKLLNELVVSHNAISKVIFENDFYDEDRLKIKLCEISNKHNVAFVKTSTGYGFKKNNDGFYYYNGATDSDLKLMRDRCIPSIQVKAAGGIRKLSDLLRVKNIGITRVGATTTESIISEALDAGYK